MLAGTAETHDRKVRVHWESSMTQTQSRGGSREISVNKEQLNGYAGFVVVLDWLILGFSNQLNLRFTGKEITLLKKR